MAPDPSTLTTTRQALHAVAEHVLAAELYRWNGHIGLRQTPGGFGTPIVEVAGVSRQLRVEGVELINRIGDDETPIPLTTIAEVAAAAGIEPGGPASVYTLVTPLDPNARLGIDAASAALLADWYEISADALAHLAARSAGSSSAQLWPEHFDLGLQIGEVNYGSSPGDAAHAFPYLYVGPWKPGPVGGFWNETFGASVPWSAELTPSEATEFFETGHREAAALAKSQT
jgi:hypothetical protein